jgi:hypothetical protein
MFDAERQIRFLYPPLFFVGSVAWAFYLDPGKRLRDILAASPWQPKFEAMTGLIVAIAGASGILVFSGFIIGSITVLILRLLFSLGRPYEAFLSFDSIERLHRHLRVSGVRTTRDVLYLSATLDHELLQERIHRWIFRRWSMFYVCANSAMALLLGWLLILCFGFVLPLVWWAVTLAGFLMLFALAVFDWRDTMGMLDFQTRRLRSKDVFE